MPKRSASRILIAHHRRFGVGVLAETGVKGNHRFARRCRPHEVVNVPRRLRMRLTGLPGLLRRKAERRALEEDVGGIAHPRARHVLRIEEIATRHRDDGSAGRPARCDDDQPATTTPDRAQEIADDVHHAPGTLRLSRSLPGARRTCGVEQRPGRPASPPRRAHVPPYTRSTGLRRACTCMSRRNGAVIGESWERIAARDGPAWTWRLARSTPACSSCSRSGPRHLNVRGAMVHVIAISWAPIGVVVAALIIIAHRLVAADPLISVLVAILI